MRSNFRPNIQLTRNFLLVIGNFIIDLNIAHILKVFQGNDPCIKFIKNQIDPYRLIKRLKIIQQANPSNIYYSALNS